MTSEVKSEGNLKSLSVRLVETNYHAQKREKKSGLKEELKIRCYGTNLCSRSHTNF